MEIGEPERRGRLGAERGSPVHTRLSLALLALAHWACAGTAEKEAAYGRPGEAAELEDLEPAGPFDATLEDVPGE
jgi:hypothetical protein